MLDQLTVMTSMYGVELVNDRSHTPNRCLDVVVGQRDEAIRIAETLAAFPSWSKHAVPARAALERLRGSRG